MKRTSAGVDTCGKLGDLILQLQTQLYLVLARVFNRVDTVLHSCDLAVGEGGHGEYRRLFLFLLHVAVSID